MRHAIAAIVLSLVPATAAAQAMTDFARGATIRAEGGSLFRVVLPDDVYETVVRADLGDVRVLNAAGDAVPHTLRRPPRQAAAEAEWRNVPSFPMSAVQAGGAGRTQVRVDATGAVLEVTGDSARRATVAYLVDVSALADPLTRLALSWQAASGVTFLTRVAVDASNDLNTWRPLVASAAVAQLQRDSLVLTQNEIELPGAGRAKYLRISWPNELSAVTMTGVRVRPRRESARPEIRWRTLAATGTEPSGAAVYDARAHLPVEYLDLEFLDVSDAADVSVRSRTTPEDGWLGRHRGLFYSLQETTGTIRSEPARTGPAPDRYWSIERAGGRGWAAGRAPRLKVGWHPHELIFVAQGVPPYTLVYGSARVGSFDAPLDALLARLDESDRPSQLTAATLEAPRTLGGPEALTQPPPVRRIVLWTVLVVAVAALALLAVRVFRDTPAAGGRPPEA